LSTGFSSGTDSLVVNGSFNGWNSIERMIPTADQNIFIYKINATGLAGQTIQYKYRAFPSTKFLNSGWEDNQGTTSFNREYAYAGGAVTIPVDTPDIHVKNTISNDVSVTFQVNMNMAKEQYNHLLITGLQKVFIAGSDLPLQWPVLWNYSDSSKLIQLYDDGSNTHGDSIAGDNIFSVKLTFLSANNVNKHLEYKYAAIFSGSDTLHGGVAFLDNERMFGDNYHVMLDDINGSQIVYSAFGGGMPPLTKSITFIAEVDSFLLDGFDGTTDSIIVNGDFNNWNSSTKMTKVGVTSQYQYITPITHFVGDTVEFKFRALPSEKFTNGGWDLLSSNPYENRKFLFTGNDSILPPIRPAIHKLYAGGINTKSAYVNGAGARIRVLDATPVNPNANPTAYVITGTAITLEAWIFPIKAPSPGNGAIIITRPYSNVKPWQSYELRINNFGHGENDPRIEFVISDGDTSGHWGVAKDSKKVRIGQWSHIAGTYDGSMVRLYINDTLVASNPFSANIGSGNTGLYIGGTTSQYFFGLIDDVRLWNTARTKNEIQASMLAVLAGNEAGLVGYWPMDSTYTSGSSIATIDKTSNHNDLVVQFDAKLLPFPQGAPVNIPPIGFTMVTPFGEAVTGGLFTGHLLTDGWPAPSITINSLPAGMGFAGDSVLWIPSENQSGWYPIIATVTNTSGSITDTVYVYAEVIRAAYNQIQLDVTHRGKIGAWGQFNKGLHYKGKNALYAADFSLVDRNDTKFAGGLYSTQNSFRPLEGFTDIPGRFPGFLSFATKFDDAWEPTKTIGVKVLQTVHISSDPGNDKFAIMEFKIINQSGSMVDDLFAQFSTDFDIGAFGNNWGGYDSLLQMSYGFEVGGTKDGSYYGFSLLNKSVSGAAIILIGEDNNYFRSTANLTKFVTPALHPSDTRNQINSGPFTVANAETLTVAIAIFAGDNLADISQSAYRARQIYHGVPGMNISPAKILSVRDVPNDNGKQVKVTWKYTPSPANNGIQKFVVWRMDSVRVFVGEAPSLNDSLYSIIVPTLFDSTKTRGLFYSKYQVSAHTQIPSQYSLSMPDSGFSLDNLVPQTPANLNVVATGPAQNTLKWNGVPDNDLFSYKVYRSTKSSFIPDSSTFIGYSADTVYVDNTISQNSKYYYAITAIDYSGNESPRSDIVTSVGRFGDQIPTVYSLNQNYPNPFNPSTTISFGLPEESMVTLKIFDALGREITTLVQNQLSAGNYQYLWNASGLSSGMYMYKIMAASIKDGKQEVFTEVKKLLLMK
ncbi:MAG: T9SS type A sorting domain-containing protein, partial [Bacteroidetes bacterium]|nr:T9SS type A sorting domain-containing protein [Bacteroidota bacterium]